MARPRWLETLAETRNVAPKRLLAMCVLLGLLSWSLLATALELSQALRFWWVDPFTDQHTALWMPVSGPAKDVAALAERLRTCLPDDGVIAVETRSHDASSFYWYLWLISHLPEYEWRVVGVDGATAPARYLLRIARGDATLEQTAAPVLCRTHPARLELIPPNP